MSWLIEELRQEWQSIKRIVIKKKKIIERNIMTDTEFQAGLPAAMQAAFAAYVAQTGFAASLVAGSSSVAYTPAPTATPPAETVSF
jgi:hypothetical protein